MRTCATARNAIASLLAFVLLARFVLVRVSVRPSSRAAPGRVTKTYVISAATQFHCHCDAHCWKSLKSNLEIELSIFSILLYDRDFDDPNITTTQFCESMFMYNLGQIARSKFSFS